MRMEQTRLSPVLVLWLTLSCSCFSQFTSAQADYHPVPEQVRLSEILIATPRPYDGTQVSAAEKKARELWEAIRKGETFDDLARANSQGPTAKAGGDLGYFSRGKLAPALEHLVFEMEVGELSEVLRTKQGFTILEVTDRIGHQKTPMEVLNIPVTVDLKPYVQQVKTKVLERWYATMPAKGRMMKHGDVAVRFVVHHDGSIAETKIASSSGDAALDDAAYKAVDQSSPFSPMPKEIEVNQLVFLFHLQSNSAEAP